MHRKGIGSHLNRRMYFRKRLIALNRVACRIKDQVTELMGSGKALPHQVVLAGIDDDERPLVNANQGPFWPVGHRPAHHQDSEVALDESKQIADRRLAEAKLKP